MQVSYKYNFDVNERVVEKATGVAGRVARCMTDEHGAMFDVEFDVRITGRRRHEKRTTELKKEPKRTTKKQ